MINWPSNTGLSPSSIESRAASLEFVFFHVGENIELPATLVASIKISNPSAKIVQLTDLTSPVITAVDTAHRYPVNRDAIMMARAEAYANLAPTGALRVFLDTDMLVVNRINPNDFDSSKIYLCKRFFEKNNKVNINFRGMGMREYAGKTLDQAWPYLGCFMAARDNQLLKKIYKLMLELEPKYQVWYGDQTALRIFAESNVSSVREVSEFEYAHLFDVDNEGIADHVKRKAIKIIHFKGARKIFIPEVAINQFKGKF